MNANVDVSHVVLETERLLIRSWKQEDLNDFYEYARVDGVGQMAGWYPHTSIEVSQQILDDFIKGKKTFALELKSNHKVIGSIGLEELFIDLGEPYTNMVGREIGYVLSKDYWGKGLMPEAVKCVIQYCFDVEKYDFLQCSHSVTNIQSQRVIEKSGFSFIKDYERIGQNGEKHISKFYVLINKKGNKNSNE